MNLSFKWFKSSTQKNTISHIIKVKFLKNGITKKSLTKQEASE